MAGLILIIVSFIFFIIEALTPTFGIFITSGIITLLLGSFMLFKPSSPLKVSTSLILSATAITFLFIWFVIWFAWRTRRRKVTTGKEGLIGEEGKTVSDLSPEGTVFIHGEYWKARSKSGEIPKGKRVKVVEIKNLILIVEEVKEN
ncbi:nodulation protein NfeD, partial [bacterium]|nr:nodulation protein NfeD [bacterium]